MVTTRYLPLIATLLVVLVGIALGVGARVVHAVASPSFITTISQNGVTSSVATATTTPRFMTPGAATTTFQYDSTTAGSPVTDTGAIDGGSLFIAFKASTTAAVLGWTFEFSNNGVDWYGENASATTLFGATTTIGEASSTVQHLWTPANIFASTTMKVVPLPTISAHHMRVNFFIPASGSINGAVYSEVNLKQNTGSQ